MSTQFVEHPHPEQERGPICVAAAEWIRENNEVMLLIERFAVAAAHRLKHIGIALIIERVRWEMDVVTHGSKFKINNNYRSHIARWLISRNPTLQDKLTLRELRTL